MKALPQHIHFLGIAGVGVSALAQLALARGVRVSGSDLHADADSNPAVARLLAGGATLFTCHVEENLAPGIELVVASAAVPESNPEIQAARRRGVRVVSRAEFLGELMAAHPGVKIAVAGTHGKTTTTAMIGVLLEHAGLDPTVFVGGEVEQLGGNVRIGGPNGPFVAEACEAYDSFLHLKPDIAVLTNIEADHLDHFGTLQGVYSSFRRFLASVPRGGTIIYPLDDENVVEVMLAERDRRHERTEIAFCSDQPASPSNGTPVEQATKVTFQPVTTFLWLTRNGEQAVHLQVPGRHNVRNALAAAAVGNVLDVPEQVIVSGLEAFRGAGRRQEVLGEIPAGEATILVMDDYAHHPTEIRATLNALRGAHPDRRLVAIFQPHLYSRTRDFLPEFAAALAAADSLVVTDVYAARETPIPGVSASDIVQRAVELKASLPAVYLPDQRDIPGALHTLVRPGDLVVFLGAGDIREQGERFVRRLQEGIC